MFSDNGKTFVGANIEFKKLHDLVKAPDEILVSYFNDEHIDWNFIPSRSPNFGGLWESGVKSFKTHLKRVAGSSNLTLEEFITLLAEIEAVLNSRPLSPLSSDFDDFETLSPGHFLIGRPVTAIVEPQLINVKENRLTRWQRVNWFSQQIWKVWKRNYLNNLQERSKWRFSKNNVEIGTLVLIKNESLPGTKWLTGRILEVFYGNDNKIRVVNLKLPDGKIIKRNVRDICILPIE
ncbi:integrase catalytic domain-containing protein [Trichonephila clavipes]|nr:integrase catalytic domain-containing protein [Trichonephila clavipes]